MSRAAEIRAEIRSALMAGRSTTTLRAQLAAAEAGEAAPVVEVVDEIAIEQRRAFIAARSAEIVAGFERGVAAVLAAHPVPPIHDEVVEA